MFFFPFILVNNLKTNIKFRIDSAYCKEYTGLWLGPKSSPHFFPFLTPSTPSGASTTHMRISQ